MKKIVLSLALVAMMSVSFVSCKDAAAEAPAVEEAPVMEETAAEAPVDSAAVATEVAPAADAAATTEAAPAAPADAAKK